MVSRRRKRRSKDYVMVLTLQLEDREKESLEKIVSEGIGVTGKTRAGALRQMIRQWSDMVREKIALEETNQLLQNENNQFRNVMALSTVVSQELKTVTDKDEMIKEKVDMARAAIHKRKL